MDFEYKLVSSLCKVFPGGENMEEMRDRRITGLKGETLSFQIAYYWGGEGGNGEAPQWYRPLQTGCMCAR